MAGNGHALANNIFGLISAIVRTGNVKTVPSFFFCRCRGKLIGRYLKRKITDSGMKTMLLVHL